MKKWTRDIAIISFLTLLLLEVGLRIIGYQPFHFPPFSIISNPPGSLVPDAELGLALAEGSFRVTMNDSLSYTSLRNTDGTRFTGNADPTLPLIELQGCSFTYGMGVPTEKAFPFLLQQRLSDHARISNKAVPGHGNIQALIQLKKRIEDKEVPLPQTIIMFYAAFHDERNALSPHYREHLHYGFMNMAPEVRKMFQGKEARFPYGSFQDEEFIIRHSESRELFRPVPLREYSAIANMIQKQINMSREARIDGNAISRHILLEMDRLCKANGIEFIIASIVKDEATQNMLQSIREAGATTLNMGLDILGDENYNNMPYDSHPNDKAHQVYAERLYWFLDPEKRIE